MRRMIWGAIGAALLWIAAPAHAQQANGFTFNAAATIVATSISANVALPGAGQRVLLQNTGPSVVWVAFGGTGVTATAFTSTSMPLLPGQCIFVNVVSWTNVAAVVQNGSGILFITQGEGAPPIACGTGTANAGASGFPLGATPITASATGTTAGTTATLTAVAGQFTYICGFSVSPGSATAAITINVTVTGISNAFTEAVGAPVTAAGTTGVFPPHVFTPCIPASAVNTAIVVAAGALGAGGVNQDVNVWGYRQ